MSTILSQFNPLSTFTLCFLKINVNIVPTFMHSSFRCHPTKILCVFPIFTVRATYPDHRIVYSIVIILYKEYKLWSYSLCNFLHSPISSRRSRFCHQNLVLRHLQLSSSRTHIKKHFNQRLNVVVEWLALLVRVWEVPG